MIKKLLFVFASFLLLACECPYWDRESESDYEYYRRTGYNRLTGTYCLGFGSVIIL